MAKLEINHTINSGGNIIDSEAAIMVKSNSIRILSTEIIKFTNFSFSRINEGTYDEVINITSEVNLFTKEQIEILKLDLETLKKCNHPEQSIIIDRMYDTINS